MSPHNPHKCQSSISWLVWALAKPTGLHLGGQTGEGTWKKVFGFRRIGKSRLPWHLIVPRAGMDPPAQTVGRRQGCRASRLNGFSSGTSKSGTSSPFALASAM